MQFAQLGDILEVLFFVAMIAIALIVRAINAVGEKRQPPASDEEEGGEWAWSPDEGNNLWREWQPDGQDFELETSTVSNSGSAVAESPQEYQYEEPQKENFQMKQQNVSTHPAPAAWSDAWEGTEIGAYDYNASPHQEATKAMEKAMAAAFPRAKRMLKNNSAGLANKRNIHINIKGRKDLRRAVLFKEALGQPRSFDL